MGTFTLTDIDFPSDAGPVLHRDPAIGDGTLWCYDVRDTHTWPSQDAAAIGAALIDLAETANATVSTDGLGWSAGGLQFTLNDSSRIVLPATSRLASGVTGFGVTVWATFTDISATTDSVLSMGKSGSGYTNTQYLIITNTGDLRWTADAGASLRTAVTGLTTGVMHQIGYTVTLAAGTLTHTLWLDGVAVDTFTTAAPMADPLTEAAARIGHGDIFGGSPAMIFYRSMGDSLSHRTAAEFIAADYAAGTGFPD